MLTTKIVHPYPAVGEIFELTLNGDDLVNDPIEMVRRCRYDNPEKWQFDGRRLVGTQSRRLRLVGIGDQLNFGAVRKALAEQGPFPEGQWREAFMAAYPEPNGKGPMGVADPSWCGPDGLLYFPYINTAGRPHFNRAGTTFLDNWLWLVPA
jgi:hypothetical protein